MRPAQLTPENRIRTKMGAEKLRRFNEAGAINAGKPSESSTSSTIVGRFNEAGAINAGKRRPRPPRSTRRACFNEAGAINAGKPGQGHIDRLRSDRFNEAGAINAGKRDDAGAGFVPDLASMRPAQLTPENAIRRKRPSTCSPASMRPAQLTPENWPPPSSTISSRGGFNEAGAINAGKPPEHLLGFGGRIQLQ